MSLTYKPAGASRLPVFVLTGFLGSGKTTLLADWLRRQPLADTAVVINEAGEVQIDGVLVGEADERIQVLEGGCLCCVVLDDLGATVERLLEARDSGAVPSFSRLLIETSGLADPGPIIHSLMHDPRLQSRVRFGGTLTVIDGVNGAENIGQFREARAQVELADAIILSKADRVEDAQRAVVERQVRRHNPQARMIWSRRDALADPVAERLLDADFRVRRDIAENLGHAHGPGCGCHGHGATSGHSALVAHAFRFDAEIDGVALIEALDLIEQLHEGEVVRSKALFRDRETGIGYSVHAVRGILDTPEEIAIPADADTGVVLFSATLSREKVAEVLRPLVGVG